MAATEYQILEKLELAVRQFSQRCAVKGKVWAVAEGRNWVKDFFKMGKISACLYADGNDAVERK